MKKLLILLAAASAFFTACESVEDDARETPIGSVISGETRDTRTYLERVKAKNEAEHRNIWRPEDVGY
ncbi:MAG: hypothetical protein J6P03_08935 [Opitutales bacterium]|nr:hypothetical protein [Opitutales bacterium]